MCPSQLFRVFRNVVIGLSFAGLVLNTASEAVAQNEQGPVAGSELVEKLGDRVPVENIRLVNTAGDTLTLKEIMLPGLPVILNPGYFDCPMLCGLVTNGLMAGMKMTQWTPGIEYQVLTISLDPEEGHVLASEKRENYLKSYDREGADLGWQFLTGNKQDLELLAAATGFGFVWDERSGQYVHPAAIVVLSPDGVITRYLYGIQYPELQLRNALYEAADGKVGSAMDRIILYCYDFDPMSNSYVPVAFRIMKLGGLVTMLALGIFLGLFWLKERRAKRSSQKPI